MDNTVTALPFADLPNISAPFYPHQTNCSWFSVPFIIRNNCLEFWPVDRLSGSHHSGFIVRVGEVGGIWDGCDTTTIATVTCDVNDDVGILFVKYHTGILYESIRLPCPFILEQTSAPNNVKWRLKKHYRVILHSHLSSPFLCHAPFYDFESWEGKMTRDGRELQTSNIKLSLWSRVEIASSSETV